MLEQKIYLGSDNFTAAHPAIVEAIAEANHGNAAPYGADPWTAQAEQLIRQAVNASPKICIVPTGTCANVLALQLACKKYESVLCSDIAHIHYQECGAAESIAGCKLLTVPHRKGKIFPEEIRRKLTHEKAFGKHSTSPRILSITQPTEVGTVYTLDELHLLSQFCKEEHLLLHMDGSRLYNAAVRLNASLHDLTQGISLDLLSLGGTKNGLMCAEAVLIFNTDLQHGAEYIQKQNLALVSKMRYFSAQYIPFFKNDLWKTLASHANQKAAEISQLIQATPQLSLSYPVETNQIFFTAPPSWIPIIQEKSLCYLWNKELNEIRLITSWNTTDKDVEGVKLLLELLRNYS